MRLPAFQAVLGQEEHANAIVPLLPKGEAQPRKEGMADLQQHTHAVAHLAGGVLSGPVLQPLHNGQGIGNNLVAGNAVNTDNRADAAGIMLKLL